MGPWLVTVQGRCQEAAVGEKNLSTPFLDADADWCQ